MIVIDANILVRAVLGRRVRELLATYSTQGIRFYAPQYIFMEAERYLPTLLAKRGRPDTEVVAAIGYFRTIIEPVNPEFYSIFEAEARERLRGRDENDWPILAAALGLACSIWKEDADFFGTGVAVWTTSRVEIFLQAQIKVLNSKTEEE